MKIYLVNDSTVLSNVEAWQIAWALDYQARFHFGRAGWRSDVTCEYWPTTTVPAGGSVLHLLDTADVAGALGYHDEDGNEVPFGRVFVKTTLDSGGRPSEVASHELLELAADPHVNETALNGDNSRLYALEVGDPAQGNAYDVGAPEGRTTGVVVADFALPSYFDPRTPATQPTSFRNSIQGPFSIAPQGYMSYIDMSNPSAGWQHAGAADRAETDERVLRRSRS